MKITGPIDYVYCDGAANVMPAGQDYGYPFMLLTADGIRTQVPYEQKLLDRYGVAYLGPQAEGLASFDLPPDPPAPGMVPNTIRGMTDDPGFIGLVRQFLDDVRSGRFKPGTVRPADFAVT